MSKTIIKNLFIIAGLSNILGVLVFSKFFTNQVMMSVQPSIMGYFGLISIVLWGLAYIAVSKNYARVPWLIAIFAIEKLAYVIAWLNLVLTQSIAEIYKSDIFSGAFYSFYGINDFVFMIFFSYVFFNVRKE